MKILIMALLFSTFAAASPAPGTEEELPVFDTPPDIMIPDVRPVPKGSYIRTCSQCSLVKGVLECLCRKSNGSWQTTSLSLDQCPVESQSVSNCNGELRCSDSC